jgi:3-oxoacyl-[acyl-carrier protein] reductase
MDPKGKVAIVTGASRGIGRQIAIELARRAATAIEAAGGRALAVQADVSKPEDCERLVAETVKAFGRLDVLVNNAADTRAVLEPIESYPRETWLRQFDANLHSQFNLIALSVPHMKAQGGGVIINFTSGDGDLKDYRFDAGPRPAMGSMIGYATTKAAISRFTNALAPELAAANIACVAIDPGFTRTELVDLLGERGVVDPQAAHSMDLPVSRVVEVITADEPRRYAGQILRMIK